jgi:hypothetical protein
MPYPMKKNAKGVMVNIVSNSIIKNLKKHIHDEDKRVDIALNVCDDIIKTIENPKKFRKNDV